MSQALSQTFSRICNLDHHTVSSCSTFGVLPLLFILLVDLVVLSLFDLAIESLRGSTLRVSESVVVLSISECGYV